MGTVTVRKLDDAVIRDLRRSAAERGVSMEQEARDRLRRPLSQAAPKSHKPLLEELRKLAVTPTEPFDQKKVSDELWDASFE
jgi:plasmid stability protein